MKPFSHRKKDQARKQEKSSNFDTLYVHETFVFSTLTYKGGIIVVRSNIFVRFSEELKAPKSPFEIN